MVNEKAIERWWSMEYGSGSSHGGVQGSVLRGIWGFAPHVSLKIWDLEELIVTATTWPSHYEHDNALNISTLVVLVTFFFFSISQKLEIDLLKKHQAEASGCLLASEVSSGKVSEGSPPLYPLLLHPYRQLAELPLHLSAP